MFSCRCTFESNSFFSPYLVFIVNLYGFKRVKGDCDTGTYTHPYFVRGKPELCCFMNRAKIKKKGKGEEKTDENTNKNTNVNSTTAEPFPYTYPVETRAHRTEQIMLGSNDFSQNISSLTAGNSSYSNQVPTVLDDSSFSPIPMRSLHQSSAQKDEILLLPGAKQSQYGLWNASLASWYEQDQIFVGQLKSSRVPEIGRINTSCNLLNNCDHVAHGIDLDLDTIFDDTVVKGSSNIGEGKGVY